MSKEIILKLTEEEILFLTNNLEHTYYDYPEYDDGSQHYKTIIKETKKHNDWIEALENKVYKQIGLNESKN